MRAKIWKFEKNTENSVKITIKSTKNMAKYT